MKGCFWELLHELNAKPTISLYTLANPVSMEVLFGLRRVSRILECSHNISKIWREDWLSFLAFLELLSFPLGCRSIWGHHILLIFIYLLLEGQVSVLYVAAISRRLSSWKLSSELTERFTILWLFISMGGGLLNFIWCFEGRINLVF